MASIDLNCDLGEGSGHDAELMPWITSCNIACGGHAGDEATMQTAVELALRHGVVVGAHPGYPDRENFGRRELSLAEDEIQTLLLRQISRLDAIVRTAGGRLTHVKPHGALYNQAAQDPYLARTVASVLREHYEHLALVAASGSCLIAAGEAVGLHTVAEVFADRTYQADGFLTPRAQPRALIDDAALASAQVLDLVLRKQVKALDGTVVLLRADTVCLHGDGQNAAGLARRIHEDLRAAGVQIRPPRD
jgi:UPF0271 protein